MLRIPVLLALAVAAGAHFPAETLAQVNRPPVARPPAAGQAPAGQPAAGAAPTAKAEDFAPLLAQFKADNERVQDIPREYSDAGASLQKKAALEAEYKGLQEKLQRSRILLAKAAEAQYAKDPAASPEASEVVFIDADVNLQIGKYQDALRQAQLMISKNYEDLAVAVIAGVASMELGDYKNADAYFAKAATDKDIKELATIYQRENRLRATDAKNNTLPQVKLTTTKGDIVIELYEDQAPNTVANFVNLVEKKFYNGLAFHRVIEGFMAQGGCPKGDGTGDPGYSIPCECIREDYRAHLRGALSMAHAGRNTGGSQFYLTFRPTPHLDGQHTVFGRVISGMDVLDSLQRIDPERKNPNAKPDKIVEAVVLRKRNHQYVPQVQQAAEEVPSRR